MAKYDVDLNSNTELAEVIADKMPPYDTNTCIYFSKNIIKYCVFYDCCYGCMLYDEELKKDGGDPVKCQECIINSRIMIGEIDEKTV